MIVCQSLAHLRPGPEYRRHPLHADTLVWKEKNCYVDVWIEVLHALGLEPLAMLPFASTIDFDDDQWTFYKPSHDELLELYGVTVNELTVWRSLEDHLLEHLAAGRLVSTEADAFWLPDAAGSDYRRQHAKTTIVIASIDTQAEVAGYFHNAGYHELRGDDYRALLRPEGQGQGQGGLPLFAETLRLDNIRRRSVAELVEASRTLWRRHLSRRPASHPVPRFAARIEADMPWLREKGLDHYHLWAFASLRQLGSAFELAALNLRWMSAHGEHGLGAAAEAFDQISSRSAALILKGARAVASHKPFDAASLLEPIAEAWTRGMDILQGHFGESAIPQPTTNGHRMLVSAT